MLVHQGKKCNREVLICRGGDELPDRAGFWVAITRGDVERCQGGIISPTNKERVPRHIVEEGREGSMGLRHALSCTSSGHQGDAAWSLNLMVYAW
jgi:hypothetical protein